MKYSEKQIEEKIRIGREFMKGYDGSVKEDPYEDYLTDQELKKPQPPLYKEPLGTEVTVLPKNFRELPLSNDILEVLYKRKSSRVYTKEAMSLLELSYLLWASQGVKSIRGNNYATLRTVACGGARHEFELYLAVINVEGLAPGYYHYMPDRHALEKASEEAFSAEKVSASLEEQNWACKGAAVFYISVIPYRAEWRYGPWSHRTALIDAGHITQNLYVAASSAGNTGVCAIAAVDTPLCDQLFDLDGEEEFIFYAAAAGKTSESDHLKEDEFYAFLKEQ